MSRLFKRKLQRLAEGGRHACLSVLLDGWPSGTAYRKGYAKLGDISLSQIMPCVTAPDDEEEEEEEEEVEAEGEGEGLRRGGAPRRWRDNGRPWAAGGKHSKAFKKGRNEKEFWAPEGRQSGVKRKAATICKRQRKAACVHKRKSAYAYAMYSGGLPDVAIVATRPSWSRRYPKGYVG